MVDRALVLSANDALASDGVVPNVMVVEYPMFAAVPDVNTVAAVEAPTIDIV